MRHTETILGTMGLRWVRQKHDGAIFQVIENHYELNGDAGEKSRKKIISFCFTSAGKLVVEDVEKLFAYLNLKEEPESFLTYEPELDNVFEMHCRYSYNSVAQFVFLKLKKEWIANLAKNNPELLIEKTKNIYPAYQIKKLFQEEEAVQELFMTIQEYILEITRKFERAGLGGTFTSDVYRCLVKDCKEHREIKDTWLQQ